MPEIEMSLFILLLYVIWFERTILCVFFSFSREMKIEMEAWGNLWETLTIGRANRFTCILCQFHLSAPWKNHRASVPVIDLSFEIIMADTTSFVSFTFFSEKNFNLPSSKTTSDFEVMVAAHLRSLRRTTTWGKDITRVRINLKLAVLSLQLLNHFITWLACKVIRK